MIQYPPKSRIADGFKPPDCGDYWMPAFAGMTPQRDGRAVGWRATPAALPALSVSAKGLLSSRAPKEWKDRVMAAHGTPEYSVATGNDYPAHERTYRTFLSLVKWVLLTIVIILIGMAYFLT